jgi:hypothetical protein
MRLAARIFAARLHNIFGRFRRAKSWFTSFIEPSVLLSALLLVVIGLQTCILHNTDKATRDAAEAAKVSATTAKDALYAERPWVASAGIPKILNPLTFHDQGAELDLGFFLKNGGRSPALGARASSRLILEPFSINNRYIIVEKIRGYLQDESILVFSRKDSRCIYPS